MFTAITNIPRRGLLALFGVLVAASGLILISDLNGRYIEGISLFYPGSDKVAHFITHVGLVGIIYWVLCNTNWRSLGRARSLALAAVLSVLLGLIDEFQQFFIGDRDFDLLDIAANLCGTASITLLIAAILNSRRLAWFMLIPLGVFLAVLIQSYTSGHYYAHGMQLIREHKYAAARESFLEAIENGQGNAAVYNELAWIELENLNTDPAVTLAYTTLAVTEKADRADYLDTHGWALYRNGRYAEAKEFLTRAYALAPDIRCIHYHLGAVYRALSQNDQAVIHLRQQLALNASGSLANSARAMLASIGASP